MSSSVPDGGHALNPGLTAVVRMALYAVAALSLASAIASLNEIGAFEDLLNRTIDITGADLAAAEQMSEGFAGLAFWVGAAAGGTTIVWWYRAYRAVEAVSGRSWSRRWAIGGWFLPVANLVIPKLVLNEIDRISQSPGDPDWRTLPLTPAANWWWGAWVGGVILSFSGAAIVSAQSVALDFDPNAYRLGLQMSVAGFAASTAAGFLGAATLRILGGRLHP